MRTFGAKAIAEDSSAESAGERSGDDGFIIIIVLGVLSLLALVAIGLQKTVFVDIRLTSNLAHRARAEALADGITRLAVRHLVNNFPADGRSGPIRLDGVPLTCRAGASVVSISFVNTDGQINLNRAPQILLERVLGGVGVADKEATRLARDIIDFRAPGDQSISGGSKLDLYRQAGLRHGPKNAPFQSVGELEQVVGMTRPLMERLRPLITVHSRFGVVNPGVVSMPVAMALAGGSASALQDLDRLKASLGLPAEFTYIPRTRGTGSTNSNTYLVRVAVSRGGTEYFTREAVVGLYASNNAVATIREWAERVPDRSGPAFAAADDAPSCIGGVLWLNPA